MHSIYDHEAIEGQRRLARLDPYRLRRMRYAYLRNGRTEDESWAELPEPARSCFRNRFSLHLLKLEQRLDSSADGASKLVFRTPAGGVVESVILRVLTGRTALCVSSQVGCAAGCSFCATGYQKPARNLSAAEIVDQVSHVNRLLTAEGRRVRNLVFMGMGEPFHNELELTKATELLHSAEWFGLPAKRTVVSTVGIPDAMERWADRFPSSPLALSLHSADQEVRESMIPLARQFPLDRLRSSIEYVTNRQKRPMLIEYLMLRDVNDGVDDAVRLAAFLDGLRVHVNLIPFNPITEAPQLKSTERPERERFGQRLRDSGLTVTIRYSQGADIDAACGQLANRHA